jgi:NADH dehydrogenase
MAEEAVVVIVGAGFAGLNLARSLAGKPLRVHLIDRHNYHTFQPLLYQVATGFLETSGIANNVRAIFRDQDNCSFTMGEVTRVDYDRHTVQVVTTGGGFVEVGYDFLVLAAGVETDFFDIPGKSKAFTLKSLDDAIRLRNQLLGRFELVDAGVLDPESGALTFAIVGGGATGVELAGAMSDLFRYTLARQFRGVTVRKARIVLVEALPRLLRTFHSEEQRIRAPPPREAGRDRAPGCECAGPGRDRSQTPQRRDHQGTYRCMGRRSQNLRTAHVGTFSTHARRKGGGRPRPSSPGTPGSVRHR